MKTIERLAKGGIVSTLAASVIAYAPFATAVTCPVGYKCINVTTTNTDFGEPFPDPDGHCSLYEAVTAIENGSNWGGCVYPSGANAILLPAGTFSVQEGLSLPNITLIGQGVGNTTLWTDGLIASGAVALAGVSSGLQQLSVQGQNLLQSTQGVVVTSSTGALIDHVRVFGFNDTGVYNFGNLTLQWSTINNNSASGGGGGLVVDGGGSAFVDHSTISTNQAAFGGGVYIVSGSASIEYSTIANNTASAGRGGGIYVSTSSSAAPGEFAECDGLHNTVAFNSATGGGGGVFMAPASFAGGPNTSSAAAKWNASIIGKNTGTSGQADDFRGTMRGDPNLDFNDGLNRNLVSVLSNPVPTGWNFRNGQGQSVVDIVADPLFLGGLASNGGPTKTVALKTTAPRSPAIDAGVNSAYDRMRGFTTDQRGPGSGFSAPVRSNYDLGSYEAR